MKTLALECGFLGIDPDWRKVLIPARTAVTIPFGLEASVSYGTGTAYGPAAIIEASQQAELFDDDLCCEPSQYFNTETLAPFPVESTIPRALDQLEGLMQRVLDADQFPVILGGERSLSVGVMRAVTPQIPAGFDAPFRRSCGPARWLSGEHFSHASAIRRCLDLPGVSVVSCGVRNISTEEVSFLESNRDRLQIFWAKDRTKWDLAEIVAPLKNRPVYISFDVDGLNSSLMPATGTPEPGGMFWDDAMTMIKAVGESCTVIGADLVELAPQSHLPACDFLVAKLTYKILAYSLVKKVGRMS